MNKTLQFYKDEIAKKRNFDKWKDIDKQCLFWEGDTLVDYEYMYDEAAERYAAQFQTVPIEFSEEEKSVIEEFKKMDDLDSENLLLVSYGKFNDQQDWILRKLLIKSFNTAFSK
jgi:hypothetical protein